MILTAITAYTITVLAICLTLGYLATWPLVRDYISRLDDMIKEMRNKGDE